MNWGQRALTALAGIDSVLQAPAPEALVVDLADSSVRIRLRWWVRPPRQMDVLTSRDEVLQAEEADGDRVRQREGWPAGQTEPPPPQGIARALHALRRNGG